jgi:hypothetical protein
MALSVPVNQKADQLFGIFGWYSSRYISLYIKMI